MAGEAQEFSEETEEDTSSMRDDFESAILEVEPDGVDDPHLQEDYVAPVKSTETVQEEEKTEEKVSTEEGKGEPRTKQTKAPVDWNPTTREHWDKLPPEVQQAVHDREVAVNQLFADTAEDRRTANNFNKMCSSYATVFAAEGIQDYMQGVQGLMNITAELQQGGPTQKAQRIVGLINHYGVDIEVLDTLLSGQQPTDQMQNQNQMQQYIQQQMQPVNQLMTEISQNRQNQQYQIENEAYTSIEEFGADPVNNYFEDVRLAMADFLDMAANNNQEMTLIEAYDRACAMNPEIAGLVAGQRAQQQQQQGAKGSARRHAAASSITGRRQNSQSMTGGGSMRDIMETAWDDANSG